MAERDPVNYAAIVGHIRRATPEEGESAECEAAIDTLCFLEERCQGLDADPGPSPHLAILDLASALIAFGAVRGVDELIAWLRKEAPARARESGRGQQSATRRRTAVSVPAYAARGVLALDRNSGVQHQIEQRLPVLFGRLHDKVESGAVFERR
jgi:hypothetical protein